MTRWTLFLVITVFSCAVSTAATAKPGHVVLGYSASWRDDVCPPAVYDFAGLTHLVRAFLTPSADGSITADAGYFNPSLESQARQHGVKLLLGIGGGANGNRGWLSIANHPQYLQQFLDSLDHLMSVNHYDGIDVDWEPSPETTADGAAYTSLLKSIRSRFPRAILTTALTTDEYAVKFFSWPDVIASVDYVNVMTYDYAGSWGGVAGFATNLYPPADYTPLPEHSVDEGMQNLVQNHHAPPGKLLLGMNFYAYRFRADQIGDTFTKNGEHLSDDLTYQQVLDLIGTGKYQAKWDAHAAAPYLLRNGGGSVVVYDSPDSVRRKCEYAQKLGCAGVMIWNVGADQCGSAAQLMDAIVKSYEGKPRPLGRAAMQEQLAQLKQTLQDGDRSPTPPLPPSLDSLTDSQLKDAFFRLNKSWGGLIDQRWLAQKPQVQN